MKTLTRKLLAGATAAGLVLGATGVADADDISNRLDSSLDAVAEVMALNVGGGNGTTQLYVAPSNGDGKEGCNLTGRTTLTLSVSSSNTAVATVSPSSVTFTSCGDTPTLTVTPISQGSATISVAETQNGTEGSFSLAPATFTASVAGPANTAPQISVNGVDAGASYDKGSVPVATCQVADAEDGNPSFAATLSAITGPYAADGIGSQTASCSYTDGGGLSASASKTYSVVDPSSPMIGHTLTPSGPDGNSGWYRSDVTLTWSVSEPQSPSSLVKTGCVDQSITADQAATSYSCGATSAGGQAAEVTVSIKRDATAPSVSPASVTSSVWRNSNLSQLFSASDSGSGLAAAADASFTLTASAESADASSPTEVTKTFTDVAGNSTTRTVSALIDKTTPVIVGGDVNNTTWRNTPLSESFTARDVLSGLASPGDGSFTLTASGESRDASAPTTASRTVLDVAGNSTTRTLSALIDLTKPTNVQLVDGPAADAVYFPNTVPANGTCTADDGLSGLASCNVTGRSTEVGTHTLNATATDTAGNVETVNRTYRVRTLTLTGFFSPVDMGGVLNTVKAGATVPLKFNIVDEGVQQSSTSLVSSFTQSKVTCTTGAVEDVIEVVSTGQTILRYDETARQFIQNWQTPKMAGACFEAAVTLIDGQTLKATFKLK